MRDDNSDQEIPEQSGREPVQQKAVRSDAPPSASSSRAPKRKATEGNISYEEMEEIVTNTAAEEQEEIGGKRMEEGCAHAAPGCVRRTRVFSVRLGADRAVNLEPLTSPAQSARRR